MNNPIYLDYAASTPVAPEVADLMRQHLTLDGTFGNPASRSHVYGWQAEEAVEAARVQVAEVINADPREIIWTSGATESNNLAIKGLLGRAERSGRRHIITSSIEHKAVLDCAAYLQTLNFEVTYLPPDEVGRMPLDRLREAIRADTLLVSLMQVNNELGVINDIDAIAWREKAFRFETQWKGVAARAEGSEKELTAERALSTALRAELAEVKVLPRMRFLCYKSQGGRMQPHV